MSAHLLPVSPEWLAKLPEGVLVDAGESYRLTHDGWLMHSRHEQKRVSWIRAPLHLVLTDTVTAAVVAVKVVWSWLVERTPPEDWRVVERAISMEPLTPEQTETLARLARAAMEAS